MNTTGMRATLALGLAALALATAPANAERYIVEPLVTPLEAGAEDGFSQAELDQLLAPIALYPDGLLSQVLVATTYPLELVEAARWSRQNPQLQGEAAVAAVADRSWDPSVKALVAFPDLLARLDEDLEWTRQVGDAMLFQEAQVMDSIQFLRARADEAGNLRDTEQVRVIREERTIVIEPAQPRVVYVPYYDPWVIYGTWWRPAYPPVVWVRPSHYYYGYPGVYWSPGIHVSSGFFYTGFYWPQRSVVIVNTPRYYVPPRHRPARYSYVPGQRWQHNPVHRRGVQYRHLEVRNRYAHRPAERHSVSGRSTAPARSAPSSGRDDRRGDGREGTRWQGSRDGQDRQALSARGAMREGSGARDTRALPRDRSSDRVTGAAPLREQPRVNSPPRSEDVTRNLRSTRPAEATRTGPTTRTLNNTPRAAERTTTTASQAAPQAVPNVRVPNRVTTSRPTTGVRDTVREATRLQATPRSEATRPHPTQRSQAAPQPQSTQRSQAAPRPQASQRSQAAPRVEATPRAQAPARESRPPRDASRAGSGGRDTATDGTHRR